MFAAEHIPYNQTGAFTKIVLDYLSGSEEVKPFYEEFPTVDGIRKTIFKKQQQFINRNSLVEILRQQYQAVTATAIVKNNIELLLSENTFTVCTAHQPNLFTGPLYFVYKVLHAIKLAAFLKEQLHQYNFIPVYYMGSEDADFAELNHTYIDGKKIEWKKEQGGAVGRMKVDKTLLQLIDELEGQLGTEAYGKEVISLLRNCYAGGKDIQTATFELVNELYGRYGLIVLIPDHVAFKAQMKKIFENDLFQNVSSEIVQQTSKKLNEHYKMQAHPREINLFYLKDDIRERIEKKNDPRLAGGQEYSIFNTQLTFSKEELHKELNEHPERFSPNVILRGLFQETILPNLVFIGGGGEVAYWLQLKDLFNHYKIAYPVLVLRNSFLIVEKKWKERIEKLHLKITELFQSENELMKQIVSKNSGQTTSLNGNFEKAEELFDQIKMQAGAVDPSLVQHAASIKNRSLKTLQELEKKMLRAEKRKFADQEKQIKKIKEALFPKNGLQERVENFSWFYAKWGRNFIDELYKNCLSIEQEFTILYQTD